MTEEQRLIMDRENVLSLLPDPDNYNEHKYTVAYQTHIQKHNIPILAFGIHHNGNISIQAFGEKSAKAVTIIYFTFNKKSYDHNENGNYLIRYKWVLVDCHESGQNYYFGATDI